MSATATKYRDAIAKNLGAYRAALVSAVQGDEPNVDEMIHLALQAGQSAQLIDNHIATMTARREAVSRFESRDWAAERAAALAERTAANDAAAAARGALEAASQASRAAHERLERASNAVNRISEQQANAERELRDTLRDSGDASDWRGITLGE